MEVAGVCVRVCVRAFVRDIIIINQCRVYKLGVIFLPSTTTYRELGGGLLYCHYCVKLDTDVLVCV